MTNQDDQPGSPPASQQPVAARARPADSAAAPGGTLSRLDAGRNQEPRLATASLRDLIVALRDRVATTTVTPADGDLGDQLGLLSIELEVQLDAFANRFSRRRAHEVFQMARRFVDAGELTLRDATVVEFGCGSVNPLGALLVHLLAGAREVHGFDLDPPQDIAAVARALARLATYMLANPAWLAPDLGLTHDDVVRQLVGFDLVRLWHGDPGGIDARRLHLHRAPAEHTGLASSSVDFAYSVSFLEHVADPDLVVAELARITRASGCGVHSIDVADHAAYGTPQLHPLDFLRRPLGPALVNGSNRLRLQQFVPVFERHGFTVTACEVHERIEVDDALRASFAPPFRALDRDVLGALGGVLFVRRR